MHDFGTCKENAAAQCRLPIFKRVWPQDSSGDQMQVQHHVLDSRTEGNAYTKLKYAYTVQKCGVCSERP